MWGLGFIEAGLELVVASIGVVGVWYVADGRVHRVCQVLPIDEAILALLIQDVTFLGREAAATLYCCFLQAAAVNVVDRVDLVLTDIMMLVAIGHIIRIVGSFIIVFVLHVLRRFEKLRRLVLVPTSWHLHEVLLRLFKQYLEELLFLRIKARVNSFVEFADREVELVSLFLVMAFDELSLLFGCVVVQRILKVLAPAELLAAIFLRTLFALLVEV